MIEYIKGEVIEAQPAYAVIEAHGIGFGLNISLNTYSAIQGKETARLWTYESIREDAYVLYGFATEDERAMFMMLIGVSGVGPATARMILSQMTVAELRDVIAGGDERALRRVKGIGQRTAQRIIVDLRDRVGGDEGQTGLTTAKNGVREEAMGALTMLGFAPAPTAKVVNAILKANPTMSVEDVVKAALKQIR